LTAIGNAVFTFKLEEYGENKLKWVNHTHEVIIETKNFISALQDTETGQRGYLLTENTTYLEPYLSGLVNAKNSLETLKKLTSDNLKQQARLIKIETSMKLKFAELKETIELSEEDTNKALSVVKNNKGKKFMDDIRSYINAFIHLEQILLEERKGDFREHRARLTTLITIEIMFFLFLAVMTVTFLNRNLFAPLTILLDSTHKMEDGKKIDIEDVLEQDEMGYLLTSFYKMHHKVSAKTEELDYSANHDELTGLKNRKSLDVEIQNLIEELQKFKTKFAVLFIDLNKFKQLNDTLGHEAGDIMLIEVANRINIRCSSSRINSLL